MAQEDDLPMFWKKLKVLSLAVASVAIPLVVAFVGNSYSNASKRAEIAVHYVEIATNILKDNPAENSEAIRGWAIEVIRHMTSKPTIHLFHANEGLPFDVRDYRGIEYKLDETDDVEDAKIRLAEQVRAVEKAEFRVSTPVTSALTYKNLVLSADPKDKMVADLADDIRRIELKVAQLESSTHARFSEIRRGIYRELRLPGEFGKDTAASARLGQTANTYRGAEEPTTMDINEEEFRDVWLERRHFK